MVTKIPLVLRCVDTSILMHFMISIELRIVVYIITSHDFGVYGYLTYSCCQHLPFALVVCREHLVFDFVVAVHCLLDGFFTAGRVIV